MKRVHAWRRPAPSPLPLDCGRLFSDVRARLRETLSGTRAAPGNAALGAVFDRYGGDADPRGELDTEVEATAAALLILDSATEQYERLAPLVDLWFATAGAAFAVRTLFRSDAIEAVEGVG